MTNHQAIRKYRHLEKVQSRAAIREALPTLADLLAFWGEVKTLSWPGSYGISPWNYCCRIASIASGAKVTNEAILSSEEYTIAMEYATMKKHRAFARQNKYGYWEGCIEYHDGTVAAVTNAKHTEGAACDIAKRIIEGIEGACKE
jgi:hypothetical protein